MFHSIIIPHRNRFRYLRHCLRSIDLSAAHCGNWAGKYEVLVVDSDSLDLDRQLVRDSPGARLIHDLKPAAVFNKSRLLNIGIEEAQGDILTFLDADAIVGCRWMGAAYACLDTKLTRVAYRVRILPPDTSERLDDWAAEDVPHAIAGFFNAYDDYDLAHEGYGAAELRLNPGTEPVCYGKHVFGNSQFSIHRDKLDDLLFNEAFKGRGFEDLWMLREIARRHGDDHRVLILTHPDWAMFHIGHPSNVVPGDGVWNDGVLNRRNQSLYERT